MDVSILHDATAQMLWSAMDEDSVETANGELVEPEVLREEADSRQ